MIKQLARPGRFALTIPPLAALASLALLAPRAGAGPPGDNIGFHLGFAKADGAEDGNGLVGAHLELVPASFLGLVGSVDYRNVETFRIDVGDETGDLDVRSVPVTAEARLYLPGMVLSPFVAGGAGWYFVKYDYSGLLEDAGFDDEWNDSFGWHVGAGAALAVSPRVSFYGEARAVYLDANRDLDDSTLEDIRDFDYDSTYFAAGVNLRF